MSITHLMSLSQLDGLLVKAPKDKLSVIDFHAQWCGPCHAIAPVYERLAKEHPSVNFYKCDVDAARDIASKYSISAMPTFVFIKGSTKVDQVRGADPSGLQRKIQQLASGSASTEAFTGQGRSLGGNPAPSHVGAEAAGPVQNLDPQLKIFLALLGAYFVFWYLSG